jgi:hypothetical protein
MDVLRFALRSNVLSLLLVTIGIAQSAGTGAIAGVVTDPVGGLVPGASVTAINQATGQTRTATTGT